MRRNSHIRLINYSLVFRVIGWLLMIEAAFMVLPMIVGFYYGESDAIAFVISASATFIGGAALTICCRGGRHDMGKHEGFLLTALVWVAFSLFGMLPFLIGPTDIDISSAFFEAMSGFTTTGCSAFDSVDHFSRAINFWRMLTQWIGGMGIILFTLAVIPMLNHSGGMQMFNAEVTGITHDKLRPRISQTAKSLWGIYFLLTAMLIILLWAGPMTFYDAVCHAFSTISTGGFSTYNDSLAHFDSVYLTIVVMVFMFLGGTSFSLIYKVLSGKACSLRNNDVFKAYVTTITIFFVMFVVSIIARGQVNDWRDVTIYPLFQIVSTITSTGLSVCNFEAWGSFILALMFLLMFSGACAGSTTGGAKIDRMLFLYKNCRNELYRSIHPNTITSVRINNKVMSPDVVSKVIAFLCIYVLVITFGGIALSAIGIPLVDAFFSSFSCVSNTGFGAGMTGYGESFEIIPAVGKWILSLLMLIGRLELFTVLILFTSGFWRK
ncbi:MAG: TrkH family potassium uptake protein [Bacteroides sp.]|nr:TrkH family potassium uptake protein [Bacteroides sp.]MCM1412887.1 TrkH family potassium uptake protein [Bacteroides sp.]MCM1471556.1 TrkH family potassium uptake protein [Bacteroides sp.]